MINDYISGTKSPKMEVEQFLNLNEDV
jgi:hypothetical protein